MLTGVWQNDAVVTTNYPWQGVQPKAVVDLMRCTQSGEKCGSISIPWVVTYFMSDQFLVRLRSGNKQTCIITLCDLLHSRGGEGIWQPREALEDPWAESPLTCTVFVFPI